MEILTPKLRFRLNRLRRRWEAWKASLRNTGHEVFTEQKMCPACRALVERNERRCPFCGEPLRVIGTGPVARAASRIVPADVPLTSLLIGVNLLIFTLECLLNRGVPLIFGMRNTVLLRLGSSPALVYLSNPISPLHGEYWRWITALFLHAGLMHIGFNMWVLFDVGPVVEQLYGRSKFLLLYLLAGVGGNLVAGFLGQNVVGASGAIMGLIGVLIAYGVRNKTAIAQQMRAQAIRFALYTLVFGFLMAGVSNAAHLGGIAAGFLLALAIGDEPPLTETQIRFWRVMQWFLVALTAYAFVLMARTPLP